VAEVLKLDDYRDQLTIVDIDGEAHKIPMVLFEKLASGKINLESLVGKGRVDKFCKKILPVIVGEWVKFLRERVV